MANTTNTTNITELTAAFQRVLTAQAGTLQVLLSTALNQEFTKTVQIISVVIMILSQGGFGLFYAGLSRARNALSSYLAVLINIAVVIACVWGVGYTFAYTSGNQFIGHTRKWFGSDINDTDYLPWVLHLCYTMMVVNIASGGMIERAKPAAYFAISFFLSVFIYPVVVHWAWTGEGWLQTVYLQDNTSVVFKDAGGSCIIHVCGGIVGFIGAVLCRPRKEKLIYPCCCMRKVRTLYPHSAPMTGFGGVLIYTGLIALQISRVVSINSTANTDILAKVIMNIVLSSLGACLIILPLARILNSRDVPDNDSQFRWPMIHAAVNAFLVGSVSVAAGCDVYYSYFAFVVGLVGGVVFLFYSFILYKCKVDDPADIFPVHFGPGIWGILAAPIFSTTYGVAYFKEGQGQDDNTPYLIFTWNLIGGIVISVWCMVLSFLVLFTLSLAGVLRIHHKCEGEGVDDHIYGEFAYPVEAWKRQSTEDTKQKQEEGSVVDSETPSAVTCSHNYWDKHTYIPDLNDFHHNHHHHKPPPFNHHSYHHKSCSQYQNPTNFSYHPTNSYHSCHNLIPRVSKSGRFSGVHRT